MALRSGYYGLKKKLKDEVVKMAAGWDRKADDSIISSYNEDGSKASKNYGIGDHFIKDDMLAVVIQNISKDDTLTLNTNYRLGNVSGLLTPVIISSAIDVDTLTASGIYFLVAAPTHGPEGISSFILLNYYVSSSTQLQIAFRGTGANMYIRTKTGGNWNSWHKYTGTALT